MSAIRANNLYEELASIRGPGCVCFLIFVLFAICFEIADFLKFYDLF